TYVPPDPLGRRVVFDALEDSQHDIWLATPNGIYRGHGTAFQNVVPGGPLLKDAMVVLAPAPRGTIWGGSYGMGLWMIHGEECRHFTTADGLSSDLIRSLYSDQDGALWIGTFGGGLDAFRNGVFLHYR